jgi:hypothetical protein
MWYVLIGLIVDNVDIKKPLQFEVVFFAFSKEGKYSLLVTQVTFPVQSIYTFIPEK